MAKQGLIVAIRSMEQKRGKILAGPMHQITRRGVTGANVCSLRPVTNICHADLQVTRQAGSSWRPFFKAEVVRQAGKEPKENPRFVITHLKQNSQWINEQVYGARGDIKNRLKERHYGLEIDRTSCTRLRASQLRVLMTAAYALMQELRFRAVRTDCAQAQV